MNKKASMPIGLFLVGTVILVMITLTAFFSIGNKITYRAGTGMEINNLYYNILNLETNLLGTSSFSKT